ncbi:MAG: hypothetical protein ACYC6G_13735 [Desulfobaccales bacterium]
MTFVRTGELRGARWEEFDVDQGEWRFGWRYIPKVGGPGADLSQPILYPQCTEVTSAWVGKGIVQWTQLKPEQNPSQWHIIKALAELP